MLMSSGFTSAQNVIKADMASSQPVVSRDEAGFSTCGVRTVVLVERTPPSVDIYDFSIQYAARQLMGTMKIGKQQADSRDLKAKFRTVRPAPVSAWIARETEGKPLQVKILFESEETPGYVLGHVDTVKGFETMVALASGERMHLLARYKSEKLDSVIAYSAPLSEDDQELFFACTTGLIERLKSTAEGRFEH